MAPNLEQINFWIQESAKPNSELFKVFQKSADSRAKLWKEFIRNNTWDQNQILLLQNWEREADFLPPKLQSKIGDYLPYLLAALKWPLAGGALDLYTFYKITSSHTKTDREQIWKAFNSLTSIKSEGDFVWAEASDLSHSGWGRYLELTSTAPHSKPTQSQKYKSILDQLKKIDQKILVHPKAKSFVKVFEAHLKELSQGQIDMLMEKMGLFSKIAEFLVEIPMQKDYADLRFQQDLVLTHFQPEKLILAPEQSEGALLGAFWEYKSLYIEKYLDMHDRYFAASRRYESHLENYRQELTALQKLDKIPALGKPVASKFDQLSQDLSKYIRTCKSDDKGELGSMLEAGNAVCPDCQFPIHAEFPMEYFEEYEKEIHKAFDAKLSVLRQRSIEKILASSENDLMKKLLRLVHVADFNKIVRLLADDKSGKIVKSLKKIFEQSA